MRDQTNIEISQMHFVATQNQSSSMSDNLSSIRSDHIKHRARRRFDPSPRELTEQTEPVAAMAQVEIRKEIRSHSKRASCFAVSADCNHRKLKPSQGPIQKFGSTKCANNMKRIESLGHMTPINLLTFCCLVLVSMSIIEGSHHNPQQFASYSSNPNQGK